MWHLKEFLLAQVGYLRRKYLSTCVLSHSCIFAHLQMQMRKYSTCAFTYLRKYLRTHTLAHVLAHLHTCKLAYTLGKLRTRVLVLAQGLVQVFAELHSCALAYLCIYTHAQVLVQALAQVNLCTCALAYLRTIAYLRTWVNTVDLVIFACFNFREFVILKLFASSSFREFSIVKKKSIVIKII